MILRSAHKSYRTSGVVSENPCPPHGLPKPMASPTTSPSRRSKKFRIQASYTTESPFPTYMRPTYTECYEVFNLLTSFHRPGTPVVRRTLQAASNSAQTCGEVPNVIEALIGTILSQNTSGVNSTRAKCGLDVVFGRNNFQAIADSRKEKVVDAIKIGGLANKKAGMIQCLLRTVKERHGVFSLQHLAGDPQTPSALTNDEVMEELLSYDGVGPKTASCVLLFCLGRDSFAVDTHVYRLSRLLGWVPMKADRVLAQAHLNIRIPDKLKYGLHVLMIQHGRACKGCKRAGYGQSCILKDLLRKKVKAEVINPGLEETR